MSDSVNGWSIGMIQVLDKAVDATYGRKKFASEAECVSFLFEHHQAPPASLVAKGLYQKFQSKKVGK